MSGLPARASHCVALRISLTSRNAGQLATRDTIEDRLTRHRGQAPEKDSDALLQILTNAFTKRSGSGDPAVKDREMAVQLYPRSTSTARQVRLAKNMSSIEFIKLVRSELLTPELDGIALRVGCRDSMVISMYIASRLT